MSSVSGGSVADLRAANKAVEYAIRTADLGLTFKPKVIVTDALHANETEEMMMQGQKSAEPRRSQGARMFFLGTPTLWTGDTGHVHLISYASKIVKRVCRIHDSS